MRSIQSMRVQLGTLVALLAVGASSPTLFNQFAQDDVPLVVQDARVHTPALWDEFLNESYWPTPGSRYLYRPLTSLVLAAEWQAGGGNPVSYKVMQLALYAAAAIAVFALALRLLPGPAAVAVALLFAVHPVHVEAVAAAVNQAEVIVGILSALAVAWYLDRRKRGQLSTRDHIALAAITLIAAHFKESGLMIPPLLFAVEVFLIELPRWRERWHQLTPLILWQTLAVAITLALRSRIPLSDPSGTFVAEAFDGLGMADRFRTMLDVVPEWFRLLLWPATLAADYSPNRILAATAWGPAQTLGIAIILLVMVLAWRLRKSAPVLSFGTAWTALALLPVSNVLIPTGIPLAERTLFLPSIGAMIAIGAVGEVIFHSRYLGRAWARRAAFAGVGIVLILGCSRSISRHRVWKTNTTLWGQTLIDVPSSYRAWGAVAGLLEASGKRPQAIAFMTEAVKIWDKTSGPLWQLGTWLESEGDCASAAPLFRRSLETTEYAPARASLISCLVRLGDYKEARGVALEGVRGGVMVTVFRTWLRTIDRAIKQGLPPELVRYDPSLLNAGDASAGFSPSS